MRISLICYCLVGLVSFNAYWADCTDSWCSPNASSSLYIASYIYANV
jgi:hypothetical protein